VFCLTTEFLKISGRVTGGGQYVRGDFVLQFFVGLLSRGIWANQLTSNSAETRWQAYTFLS